MYFKDQMDKQFSKDNDQLRGSVMYIQLQENFNFLLNQENIN